VNLVTKEKEGRVSIQFIYRLKKKVVATCPNHCEAVLSMVDGRVWRKAKIPPHKHAIVAYGTAIAGLPSQNAYGGWQKISHAILLWHHHLKTMLQRNWPLKHYMIAQSDV